MRRLLAIAGIAGLALGLFSVLGDRLPPTTPLHVLVAMANAAGPWLVVAFAAGAAAGSARRGSAAAAIALALAVAIYYAGIYASGHSVSSLVRVGGTWAVVALVAGVVVGAAGGAWAGHDPQIRGVSVALLCGSLLAEAAFRVIQGEAWLGVDVARADIQVAIIDGLAGLGVPILLARRPDRMRTYAVAIVLACAGTALLSGAELVIRTVVASVVTLR